MRSGRKRRTARNVDEYMASAPANVREVLKNLRKAIREATPEAEEIISYQIPAYKYGGPVVFFAAFENHLSLFVPGESTIKKFSSRLKPYVVRGATIRFTVENPLPASLVRAIVRSRVKEDYSRSKQKK